MSHVLPSLLPIFALILMGFVLRHKNLLAREFWLPCEQLNYFYLFPVLMFSQVARPLLTLWIGAALHIPAPQLATVVLFNALPCTPSAYIMSKLLGGGHRLAAGIITAQAVLAAVTMPLIAALVR